RESGGFVKAMALVNANGSIARQFVATGGVINGSFNVSYSITFPFKVDDRFISVTPMVNFSGFQVTYAVEFGNANTVSVTFYDAQAGGGIANRFFIFVY